MKSVPGTNAGAGSTAQSGLPIASADARTGSTEHPSFPQAPSSSQHLQAGLKGRAQQFLTPLPPEVSAQGQLRFRQPVVNKSSVPFSAHPPPSEHVSFVSKAGSVDEGSSHQICEVSIDLSGIGNLNPENWLESLIDRLLKAWHECFSPYMPSTPHWVPLIDALASTPPMLVRSQALLPDVRNLDALLDHLNDFLSQPPRKDLLPEKEILLVFNHLDDALHGSEDLAAFVNALNVLVKERAQTDEHEPAENIIRLKHQGLPATQEDTSTEFVRQV